jgi:hypothetical protein
VQPVEALVVQCGSRELTFRLRLAFTLHPARLLVAFLDMPIGAPWLNPSTIS